MILRGIPIRDGRLEGVVVVAEAPASASTPTPLERAWSHSAAILVGPVTTLRRVLEGLRDLKAALVLTDVEAPARLLRGIPVPTVGGLPADLFSEGDRARLDGSTGTVDLPGVTEVHVVTAFLRRPDGKVLLLKRSKQVGSGRGLWAGVSGFVEAVPPEAQARIEVEEETGIARDLPKLLRAGGEVRARQENRCWVVHPFLLGVPEVAVRLDWEHTESEWVDPSVLADRPTVPKLAEAFVEVTARERVEKRPSRTKR